MTEPRDRELGMHRKITRRDFLNGVAVTAGAFVMPWDLLADQGAEAEKSANYYPPALTGMRGSHPGSFDVAHSLRDGTFWDSAAKPLIVCIPRTLSENSSTRSSYNSRLRR